MLHGGYDHADYLRAATIYWGTAGHYAVTEYDRLNRELFAAQLPPLPIVIGLTAYGRCLGLTRSAGSWDAGHLPRITLASPHFARGRLKVSDVLTHEMLHVDLVLRGLASDHNGEPWCRGITALSPAVLGHTIMAAPVKVRRINGKPQRQPLDGHLPRAVLADWPDSLRPKDWDPGEPFEVENF